MLTIAVATFIFGVILQPENQVKSKIEAIASDYYENHIYEGIINSPQFAQNPDVEATLSKYREVGLSTVYLGQLLLYDNQKYANEEPYLTNYCDKNNTAIKYYPEPPYSKTSYRTEYIYSCKF